VRRDLPPRRSGRSRRGGSRSDTRPDLLEEYAEATLCLVPLIVGAGLKIKLVEAFCHGRTGAATSIGVQGLEGDVGGQVAVADDPDSFAREVVDLTKDHERRKVMKGANACLCCRALLPKCMLFLLN